MNQPYIWRPMLGHRQFISPLAVDRRPPVGRDTRARPAVREVRA